MSQRQGIRADIDDLWQTVELPPSVKSVLNGSRYTALNRKRILIGGSQKP